MILEHYNSNFVTYELSSGIYTINDISDAVYTMDHEGTLKIGYDDISMKTKLILTRFGGTFGTLKLDNKFFLKLFLGFTPYWNFKPTNALHADSAGVYTSNKILNINTKDQFHFECDVIDGSILCGVHNPVLYSFVLSKPSGYKVLHQPETVHYKKNK